jgi:hypothetical protein
MVNYIGLNISINGLSINDNRNIDVLTESVKKYIYNYLIENSDEFHFRNELESDIEIEVEKAGN